MDAELNDKLPDHIAEALGALDRDATRRAEAVDAQRVAARVLQRLKDEPVRVLRPRRVTMGGLRIAAVLALLVIGGVVTQRLVFHDRAAHALAVLPPPAPGTNPMLDASTQAEMLDAVDEARTATDSVAVPSTNVTVDDLNAQELQTLLNSMDQPAGGTE